MKNYTIWLSYDLGFRDAAQKMSQAEENEKYQERYNAFKPWLDEKDVQFLGDSVVLFSYEIEDNQKVVETLKLEILKVFKDAKIEDLTGVRMYALIAGNLNIQLMDPYLALIYSDFIIDIN